MGSTVPKAETVAAITSVTSLLALIFMAAFAMILILLVRKRCHRNRNNQGTPMPAPEANYSTVGPPLRIERNMSYEEKVIHTDNRYHLTVEHDTI